MNNFDKNMEEIFDVTPTEPKKGTADCYDTLQSTKR